MKKAKKLAQKKAALSTVLTVLALCGTLSVSAADPVTMDLTSGTDHPNKVSSSSTTADTVAIGFDTVHAITVGFGTTLLGETLDYSIYYLVQSGGSADWRREYWPSMKKFGFRTPV